MNKKILMAIFGFVCLMCMVGCRSSDVNELATTTATPLALETTINHIAEATYILDETIKEIGNGDVFTIRKFEFLGGDTVEYTLSLEGTNATVFYCDTQTKTWHQIEANGQMPIEMLYIKTDLQEMIIAPAFLYKSYPRTTVVQYDEYVLPIEIEQKEESIDLYIRFQNMAGYEGHIYELISDFPLLELNSQTEPAWATHFSTIKQRFLYDGYYYEMPTSYEPYAKNMFYRNPSAYTPSKFVNKGETRAELSMGYAMLDIIANNVEENGIFWTYPKSIDFLYDNYGIEEKFYDTRFNADITKTFLNLYLKTSNEAYKDIVINSLEFFITYANNHNYTFEEDGEIGILVEDYYHENGNYKKTHSSLNHHVAEANVLYLAYDVIGDSRYLDLANKMVKGVELTRDLWLKDDFSLEYAYLNDGTMGFVDYPYLTYNDLIELMEIMEDLGLPKSEPVEYLVTHKKIQMDRDGITGYNVIS